MCEVVEPKLSQVKVILLTSDVLKVDPLSKNSMVHQTAKAHDVNST